MAQQVHDLAPRRGASAAAAEGLAERRGVDVDAIHHAVVLGAATALRGDRVELGDVAVHAEHAVGDDGPCAARLRLAQLAFEVAYVGVRVVQTLSLAETDAVDDGDVIERVADHRVFRAEQRLE